VLFGEMRVICVLCLIVVPLPPGKNPFAVKIYNNNNNNNNNECVTLSFTLWEERVVIVSAGFEVVTTLIMENIIFWSVVLCSLVEFTEVLEDQSQFHVL
jgi:hypothetical protein